jgi:hypothetical protein
LRKLAYPALKEAIKMNRRTLKVMEFIELLRGNIIPATVKPQQPPTAAAQSPPPR